VNRQSSDLSVIPVLKAGQTPGTVDVDLKVKDDLPVHAALEVNNRNTPDTTATRVNFNLSYANLFQTFQSLSLQYQLAPERPHDANVLSGTYLIPFAPGGPSLALYGIKTNSDVAAVGTLSVVGKGEIYGARYIVPLPAGTGSYQSLTFGGDYKSFGQNVLLVDGGGIQTPIHYLNWTGIYSANLATPHTRTGFEVDTNFGIRGVANTADEFENNRAGAQPNYFYLRFNASHERVLTHGWSLALRLNSQYTAEPLISNEQFAIGGALSVRGYLESEALGDSGISGGGELRSPSLPALIRAGAHEAFGYLFTDGGIVALIDPLPTQLSRTRIWSWGGGVRLTGLDGLDAEMSVANARDATSYTRSGDVRFLFDVRYGL
jgi:hemolysin activation/secretion protein